MLRLGEQNAIRHQLDQGIRRRTILETHLDAHPFADTGVQLFGHAPCNGSCRQTTWLSVANQPLHAPAEGQADLRQLRCFTGTGFATHNHDRVRRNGRRNVCLAATDGQRFGERDPAGQRGHARLTGRNFCRHIGGRRSTHKRHFNGRIR